MLSPLDTRSPRRSRGRKLALWAGLAVGGILPTVGCQVEYAGMTLPSGKYMHDDVQYFPPGPDFPYANTQAATHRARMQAQGLDVSGAPVIGAPSALAPGAVDPSKTPPAAPVPAGVGGNAGAVDPAAGPPPNLPGGPGNAPAPPPAGNPGADKPDAPAGDMSADKPGA